MRLPRFLRGAPDATPPRRRPRRAAHADAPRTIIPLGDDEARAIQQRLDAARDRLRHAIPPVPACDEDAVG